MSTSNDGRDYKAEYESLANKVNRAVHIANDGQIDGAHHRLWVIDQMVRVLLGDMYSEFVDRYEENGEYEWDTGIAP